MKTKLFTALLLVLAGAVWGQEEESSVKTGNYYFNYPDFSNLKELSFDSNLKNTVEIEDIQKKVSGSKYRITVTKIKDEKVYFVFGKFKDTIVDNILNKPDFSNESEIAKSLFTSAGTSNNKVSNKIVYNMPLKDFEENTKILYKRVDWRVGVFTIPYKLRFSDFSFDANVNIGVSLGGKIRINREKIDGFSLEPIIGFGLASIKLEDSNSSAETTTNVSAFTINTGFLIHLTNKINLGVTYGFDNISKNDQNNYNWKYNGKGWLGIGINVAFSTGNENSGATGNNN